MESEGDEPQREPGASVKIWLASWRDLGHPLAGGAEEYTDQLLSALVRLGHDVTLFSSRFPGSHEREIRNGYEILRTGNQLSVYGQVKKLIRRMDEADPDLIIEEVNTIPFLLGGIRRNSRHAALFFQTCEDIWPYLLRPPLSWIGRYFLEPRWMSRFVDVPTVTLTRSNRIALERFGLRKVSVVPPGRTPSVHMKSMKSSIPTCIHVGRIVKYKRLSTVIRACGKVREFQPDLKLIIVGDGPDLKRLKRDSPSWVEFTGRLDIDRRDELVSQSHLQIVASIREGWGLVVTEAATLGTPTLGPAVPGLMESIASAGGWLCPDDLEAMARWIRAVLPKAINGEYAFSDDLGCLTWDAVASEMVSAYTSA